MTKKSILWHIKKLRRGVFTTSELCALSGKSASAVVQGLNFLEKEGIVLKIYRGIWTEAGNDKVSPYTVIPFLLPRHRAYVSFISALHLYGIIEQIPQVITLATTSHTKAIHTKIADYSLHQLDPAFFDGFGWYKDTGSFLIAEPEKALIDCLYISARKKRRFGRFPELYFPESFSFKKAEYWAGKIRSGKLRACVRKKLRILM